MAEPDWNPDTGGRSLAEILREAGIESANRAARRRSWDDPEETGIRQRRAEAAAAGRPDLGRRKSDRSDEEPPVPERRAAPERRASERRPAADPRAMRRPEPGPSTAAIPGLRPDRKPGVPVVGTLASAPVPTRKPGEPPAQRSVERLAQRSTDRSAQRVAPAESHPMTGPIPVVRPEQFEDADDLDSTPQESALAWLRFAGELIIALAAGVGVYFAATLLWENLPHVAVLLAPLAVTALVAGVGVWRQKQGREPVGPRLLAVLVFAGTLLTIAPAAGLLAAGS
ncbi:hypothetical protein [Blastococcus sp. CT_GayMR16]|uniref:hypothetical protein n=1 Tax=Blastococcus sp. CT_GayMR16 TaxID=2559607 RepID=UPI0010745140|nr:hypothetical protein [Blastococcus sp. CT_GayMR16]TFV82959.1 hypothetical protein E4P38_21625 [Blastococcus sp. CT_GayMR16]